MLNSLDDQRRYEAAHKKQMEEECKASKLRQARMEEAGHEERSLTDEQIREIDEKNTLNGGRVFFPLLHKPGKRAGGRRWSEAEIDAHSKLTQEKFESLEYPISQNNHRFICDALDVLNDWFRKRLIDANFRLVVKPRVKPKAGQKTVWAQTEGLGVKKAYRVVCKGDVEPGVYRTYLWMALHVINTARIVKTRRRAPKKPHT